MSQALRNLKRSCLSKNGGNKPVVYLIIPAEVEATAMADQLAVGHTVRPAPVLNSGAVIYSMETDRRTLRFSESEREGPQGESYDLSLTWKASPMTPELIDARRRMRRRRVHVLWTDLATDKTRYMELAKPTYSGDSSNTRGNRNEAIWTMSAASKYPAPFLDTVLADGQLTDDGIILIHAASGLRFALSVNANGSLITTPVASPDGVPSIPLNNGYSVLLGTLNGTLTTNTDTMGLHQQIRHYTTAELEAQRVAGLLVPGWEYFDTDLGLIYTASSVNTLSGAHGQASTTSAGKTLYRQVFDKNTGPTVVVTDNPATLPAANSAIEVYVPGRRLFPDEGAITLDWSRTQIAGEPTITLHTELDDEWLIVQWYA